MKLLLVGKIDPNSSAPCGIRGYVSGLIKPYSKKDIKIVLLGTSPLSDRDSTIPEQFKFINVTGWNRRFSNSQAFFLVSLYLKGLLMNINGFFSDIDLIHVQRIDQALPFVFSDRPVVCTLHGKGSEQANEKHGKIVYQIYRIVENSCMSRIEHAIAVSDDIYQFYVKKYPWASSKMSVINNGVDISVFKQYDKQKMREKYGFESTDKIVLYMGRFHEEKNLGLLISSFNHLLLTDDGVSIKLVLIGEGQEKHAIIDMIRQNNLEQHVRILDPVPDAAVPEIMNCADVFALPSVVEGFPLVIIQALACGIPVVSTRVGEVPQVVINDVTGYIVENYDETEFGEKLKFVAANSDRFTATCIKTAQDYSWDAVAERNLEIYEKIILNKGGS